MSAIKVITKRAPAEWASYLVNGDSSGLAFAGGQLAVDDADAWAAEQAPAYVVDCADDASFGRFFYASRCIHLDADVATYTLHVQLGADPEDYKGAVLSEATLRDEDLYAAFLPVLRLLAPDSYLFKGNGMPDTYAAFCEREEDEGIVNDLIDALSDAAPDGYTFGASDGDGACFGFWETEEHTAEREWAEFTAELAAAHGRTVTLCGDEQSDTFKVFAFGAYGDHFIAVGSEPNRYRRHGMDICEALEVAAAELQPGYFTEPDYEAACEELGVAFAEFQAASDPCEDFEKVLQTAESDLTYTESGYLVSYEWTIVGESMDRAALLAFARGE
jgi:hypothetical protein